MELNCKHNRNHNVTNLLTALTELNQICTNHGLLENTITYLQNLKP